MAYNHTEYEVYMTGSGAVTAAGRGGPQYVNLATGAAAAGIARWTPGMVPHIVRNIAVISMATNTWVTKPVIHFRVGPANCTGTVSGQNFTTMTLTSIAGTKATAGTAGGSATRNVWYKSALLNQIVNPGQDVVAVAFTKATNTGKVKIALYVEPKWETPGNLSNMKTA